MEWLKQVILEQWLCQKKLMKQNPEVHPHLVWCRWDSFGVSRTGSRLLLLDFDPRHRGRVQRIQKPCALHGCSGDKHTVISVEHGLWTMRSYSLDLRGAGMSFTLISLVEFEGVFRGLYFFSRGGVSEGPVLDRQEDLLLPQPSTRGAESSITNKQTSTVFMFLHPAVSQQWKPVTDQQLSPCTL